MIILNIPTLDNFKKKIKILESRSTLERMEEEFFLRIESHVLFYIQDVHKWGCTPGVVEVSDDV